jgi:hypothetical protein
MCMPGLRYWKSNRFREVEALFVLTADLWRCRTPKKTEFFKRVVSTKNITIQILRYVCRGDVDIDEDNVCELLQTSDYFRVPDIAQMCYDFLRNKLNPENCIGIMRYAR